MKPIPLPGSKVSQKTVSEAKSTNVTNAPPAQKAPSSEKPAVKSGEKPAAVAPKVAKAEKKPGKCYFSYSYVEYYVQLLHYFKNKSKA